VETEDVNAEHGTGTSFLNLLPDTPQKYLGLYNDLRPQDSKTATLRNMLMVRRNYDALVSGDGRVRRLRREEHSPSHRGSHRSVHASALPREGRSVAGESQRTRKDWRAEARGLAGAEPRGVQARALLRRAPQGVADAAEQSGIENREYKAQRSVLADVDAGRTSRDELFAHAEELMRERLKGGTSAPASASHGARPAATAPGAAAVGASPRAGRPASDGNIVTT
jgi:hypothetical protein